MADGATMVNLSGNRGFCNDCVYSSIHLAEGRSNLICRRMPPQSHAVAIPTPQGVGVQPITLWPQVDHKNWCGEFCPSPVSQKIN